MQFLKKVFAHSPGHYIAAVILAVAAGAFRFLTLPPALFGMRPFPCRAG